MSQSFSDFILFVIDDGSSDDTPAILKHYENEERIHIIRQENSGRSRARNLALELCTSPYVAFLDSDDTYLPEKLKKQIAYLDENPDVDMLYTSAICVNQDGLPHVNQPYLAKYEGNIHHLIAFFQPLTITLPTVMVRRHVLETVGYFDVNLDRFEDTDLWRRIAKKHKIGALQEATCFLTTHDENSLKNQNANKITQSIDYYINKIFAEDADMDSRMLRKGASRLYEYYARAFLQSPNHVPAAFYLLMKAYRYDLLRAPGITIRAAWSATKLLLRQISRIQA